MITINFGKIASSLVRNWLAKVLAVIFAIFLFMFHRLGSLESRFFSVPLQVESGEAFTPATALPGMVRVSLRGEANSIFPIQESDIVAFVDLNRYSSPGTWRVPLQIRKKGTALGVEPLEISVDPVEIMIELDYRESKTVPLVPAISGYPEPGYEMVSSTITPPQAVIAGPRKILGTVRELRTETIDLNGRNADFQLQPAIVLDDPRITVRGPLSAEFHGYVRRLIIIRSFENLPVTLSSLGSGFQARPEIPRASVRIQGNQDELENWEPRGPVLLLDCSRITAPGSWTVPLRVDIPAAFTLVNVDPASITLEVREK